MIQHTHSLYINKLFVLLPFMLLSILFSAKREKNSRFPNNFIINKDVREKNIKGIH